MSMRSPSLVPLKDSIATQLLKTMFALYLALVVTVTLLQLMAQYVQTKTEVLQELTILEATLKPGLSQALWEMNAPQTRSITVGVVRLPTVVGVRIRDYDGNVLDQIGQVVNQQGKVIVVDQEGNERLEGTTLRLFWHEFPLVYTRGDQDFPVGTVTIYSSPTVVFRRIRFGFLLLMLAAGIQITAFGLLFLWISRTKLSRPLAELTHAAGQLDLENLENITMRVHTSGRNELKLLEETFNTMVQKLLDARTTLYEYANELHQNRQQLQDILDNTTAVIFIKDIEGRYLLINRQYELLFHISKADITGKTDYDVFPKEAAEVFRNNDQQVVTANGPVEVEEHVPHDDGVHIYLSVKFPLRATDGHIYAVCGIATDISERKRAEEQIRTLNQELEQRVQERTARLSETNALLKKSEQRLKEAQRIAKLGNWEWNIRTNELFWSDESYRIFGVQPQKFGATYEAFVRTVHPDDRETVQQAVNNAVHHGAPYSLDHRIFLPDNTVRMVHEQGEVIFDEQHEPVRMLGTVQDITERKKAEEAVRASEHQLRMITDNTPAYIAYVGIDDLRYRFVNRNFEIAYAKPREQIIGQHIKNIIGDANYQFALRYIDMVRAGQPASYENSFPTEQGMRWIQANYVPDFDEQGAVRAIVVMSHDITKQKNTELLLQQAKEAAEAANRAKSTFLANMSHELRTPLHGILGFAQRLEQDTSLTESQQQSIDIIHRNGEHLLTLLNDILDFTRIEADTFELRPARFALPSLIRQLADMARLNAERKGVTFICDIPETLPHIVYGDQKRLRQVLLHLLGNAVKFTQQGSVAFKILGFEPVQRQAERLQTEDAEDSKSQTSNLTSQICNLKFEISDTGLGITPKQVEHIFQPFWQAVPYQLHSEGAGLGLTISQQILRKMGAELHCSSTVGKGSVFWFNMEMPVIDTTVTDVVKSLSERSSEYPSQETLTAALAALPADWLTILRQGAADVDLEALMGIIPRIRKRDFILGDALTRLMEDFDYDGILRLTEESV